MSAPIDEEYFTWLYSQIGHVKLRNRARTYWELARIMYQKEFIWFIPNDDNRAVDGRDLRQEFLEEAEIDEVDPEWMTLGCSMLEMCIALSRRLAFETDGQPRDWFWHLIEQLDLKQYSDRDFDKVAERKINDALDRVIWRTYSPTGRGGLFPLRRAQSDQTEVELWYQANEYLLENF